MNHLAESPDRLAQRRLTKTDLRRRRLYRRAEVCGLLRMSVSHFKRKAAALPWVQEVLPRVGRPLYLAAPLDRYLAGEWPLPASNRVGGT